MVQAIPSRFESFQFTKAEQMEAIVLTTLQRMWIQNLLHAAAMKRLNIEVDPNNFNKFIQEEAAIKGEILAYTYLLDCSDTMEVGSHDVTM